MRVALLSAEYPPQPGGVGDYTRCLAHALADRGHTLTVLSGPHAAAATPAAADEPGDPGDPGSSPLFALERAVPAWDWRCWPAVIAALARLRPDVLHIQYQTGAYGMHPAINLLPWRLRGLRTAPRVFVTFHDLLEPYLFPKAGALRRWITLRLACDAAGVVVTNQADAASLHAGTPWLPFSCRQSAQIIPIGSNIAVAPPPGFTRADWRAALGVSPDELLIAYFGLFAASKGIDLLLDACEQLWPALPLHLLLIGGAATAPHDRAYAADLRARMERSPLRGHIRATGHVAASHVSAHLLASDLVVLPFWQGASFRSGSLLAALAHGAAVVTTQRDTRSDKSQTASTLLSDAAPRLCHGENVWLVPAGDSQALAAALRQLARLPAQRSQLQQGARLLGAQFAWEAIARRHEWLYNAQ
jgi:glycosyltransferase involved in cell wall biosynthesis